MATIGKNKSQNLIEFQDKFLKIKVLNTGFEMLVLFLLMAQGVTCLALVAGSATFAGRGRRW